MHLLHQHTAEVQQTQYLAAVQVLTSLLPNSWVCLPYHLWLLVQSDFAALHHDLFLPSHSTYEVFTVTQSPTHYQ